MTVDDVLEDVLLRECVSPGEVLQAVRSGGFGDLDRVAAVVLETDGTFSVISRGTTGSETALADVRGD